MTEDEDLESFRAEVRAFLDAELPPEKRFAADGFANSSKELTAWWQGVRAKRGWGAPGWPKHQPTSERWYRYVRRCEV